MNLARNQPGSRRPRPWVLLIAASCVAVLVAFAIWWRGTAAEVTPVVAGPIQHTLVFSSRVSSVARTDLASTLTARVEKVFVREGDRVKAGQLLIAMDDDDLRAQRAQAEAALATTQARLRSQWDVAAPVASQAMAQSRANLDFAQRELDRTRSLHQQGFVGDARLQDAERALATARAAHEQANAQASANNKGGAEAQTAQARVQEAGAALAVIRARLEQTTIVAPADGRVIARTVEVGDVAQPGRKLLTLAMTGETRLIAQIDEKNLSLLREGMHATASADAFPDTRFDAELIYLAPSVDVQRGTVEARFRVAKPPAILRDDMTVSAEVIVAQKANALSIPAIALRDDASASGSKQVLVVRDGVAHAQTVRVGIRSLQRAEVIEGLAAGEGVVIDDRIRAGQRVRAVAPSATARPRNVDLPMPTQ
ncbi:MAG: efflux RND transporter periplasmic adaptor subunit [Burkholderiales bacterium]|nr:efflux RND transporter periplasmic adaptor subunit [Burkholderiales bacterium]